MSSRKVDFQDLRKHMHSANLESPALGSVTCHVEIERLFSHFITSNQAEITQPDIERVAQHYGYNRDFAKRCYTELKRDRKKLGAGELWLTLSQHLHTIDDDVIKFISEQLSFPHLYRYPGDRRGGKVYNSVQQIISAQNDKLKLNGKQESGNDMIIKDLCLSYGKMIFSKKMDVSEWWRGFSKFAVFCLQTNGFMANYKECCLCLADFIYKYGSHPSVEQKIARLISRHVFHYKAYVGNPQSECLMYVILAFAKKITAKTLSFFIGLLVDKFNQVKTNSKRCEIIMWSLMQLIPAINGINKLEDKQVAVNDICKLISYVFTTWTANKQEATRQWAALASYQFSKYGMQMSGVDGEVFKKIQNLLNAGESKNWDAEALTGGVFPIFDEDGGYGYEDAFVNKKKKVKKKKKKQKKEKLSEKEKKRRRKEQIRAGRDQQYKMYGNLSDMGQSMQSLTSDMATLGFGNRVDDITSPPNEELSPENDDDVLQLDSKQELENFKRMQTMESVVKSDDIYDPDNDIFDVDPRLSNDSLTDLIAGQLKQKEEEKKKLLQLKQKKFFLMDDKYLFEENNAYNSKIRDELNEFIPLLQWDSTMIKTWIKRDLFHIGINDIIEDYFPDYINGYMLLNFIRYPYEVCKHNLRQGGYNWPDRFFNGIWLASKEFHSKYLLELGINICGECCGQIAALKIESHRLSHILQENDIIYDPQYSKQCVTQELIAPAFEELLAIEDGKHPRWTDNDAKQLKSLYLRLASKLEKETLELIKNESKYYEAMRKTQIDLREMSTRVDIRYFDLENFNTQLTTQELMLRDLAVKSKHLTLEKNQLLNEYASAVNEKNYYLRELHINGKLPYIQHLEKLKAEIQRQVDDVTLLDYQKDSILLTEKNWIDLCDILIRVFESDKDSQQKQFESELKQTISLLSNNSNKSKKKRKRNRQNTPKHRKNASSMAHVGKRNKHRRNSSMSNSGDKKRRKSSIKTESELETFMTLHNRETNIDIVCVLKKIFTYFLGDCEHNDVVEFLPEFNAMIDALYDIDDGVLHYEPVDIDETSLKKYVQAGRAARMALLAAKKKEEEEKEKAKRLLEEEDNYKEGMVEESSEVKASKELMDKVGLLKESLGQHNANKLAPDVQLKEMEKQVAKQKRRDRHKKLLEKDKEVKVEVKEEKLEEKELKEEVKEEEKEEKHPDLPTLPPPPPPPAPFYEKHEEDDEDEFILPPPPPTLGSRVSRIQEKHHRYKKSMMNAQELYATQWEQYRAQQVNYAQQYQIAQQQYANTWQMLQNGQITPQYWQGYQRGFVVKWRRYQYWLQYKQMYGSQAQLGSLASSYGQMPGLDNRQSVPPQQAQLGTSSYAQMPGLNGQSMPPQQPQLSAFGSASYTQLPGFDNRQQSVQSVQTTQQQKSTTKLYEIACEKFDKEDADLWLKWKESKNQQSNIGNVQINNIDKMMCLRIENKINDIYKRDYPQEYQQKQMLNNMQRQQSWNNEILQHQMYSRMSQTNPVMQQYVNMQRQSMQQRFSQMTPQQQQYYAMQANNPSTMQQYYRQMSGSNQNLMQYPRQSSVQMQQQYVQMQQQYAQMQQQMQQQQQGNVNNVHNVSGIQGLSVNLPPVPPPPVSPVSPSPEQQVSEYTPTTGNRLRGAIESEDKKRERERRRLERKMRRKVQKLTPSAQQQANDNK